MPNQIALTFPDRDKGFTCEFCGSYCKLYKRSFNSNMGLVLKTLYENNVIGFVHIEDYMREKGFKRCGDASYLVHYGFLEKMTGKRLDGSSKLGYYKLTGRAILFLEGKITAKEKLLIYNNKPQGFAGKDVTIQDVLKEKFDFQKLMSV